MSDCFDHEGDAWDSLDNGFFNDSEPRYYRPPRLPHCRKCGALCAWYMTATGWRLFKNGALHYCSSTTPDDFDDLEPQA